MRPILESVRVVPAKGDVVLVHQVLQHLLRTGQTSLAADDLEELKRFINAISTAIVGFRALYSSIPLRPKKGTVFSL